MSEEFCLSKRVINQKPDKWKVKGYPLFDKEICREGVNRWFLIL